MKFVLHHEVTEGMLLWPFHFLPRTFTSFCFHWCENHRIFFPNSQSHFLLFEKQQLHLRKKKCQHLLPKSLASSGNLEMPTLRLFFVSQLTDCCSLLVISPTASKLRTIWKFRKRQVQGRLFRTKRGVEDFNLNPLFHPSFFLWRSGSPSATPISCFFWSHSPNTRPKKFTVSL